jgi:RNA polymerase sigma-70 factor (ECF subfamily)
VAADAALRLDGLFQAHERRVLAYAMRRTASPEDAEDAAAETFAIAWRKIEQAPDEALPWLLSIARRVISNQRRGRRRRAWLFLKMSRSMSPEPVTVPGADQADDADAPALAALSRLRADDREILRLVAWEELDNRGVGVVLGITPNAAAIRLHRARKRFRDELLKEPGPIRTSTEQKDAIDGALQERVE